MPEATTFSKVKEGTEFTVDERRTCHVKLRPGKKYRRAHGSEFVKRVTVDGVYTESRVSKFAAIDVAGECLILLGNEDFLVFIPNSGHPNLLTES